MLHPPHNSAWEVTNYRPYHDHSYFVRDSFSSFIAASRILNKPLITVATHHSIFNAVSTRSNSVLLSICRQLHFELNLLQRIIEKLFHEMNEIHKLTATPKSIMKFPSYMIKGCKREKVKQIACIKNIYFIFNWDHSFHIKSLKGKNISTA